MLTILMATSEEVQWSLDWQNLNCLLLLLKTQPISRTKIVAALPWML